MLRLQLRRRSGSNTLSFVTRWGKLDARLHYSVKANSSIAILALLRELGAGLDIVSGGELYRALKAGYKGKDIVFSGVGKTEREMEEALRAEVLLFNVESEQELHVLDAVAKRLGVKAPVALRVNPEVLVDTPHPYTRTGEKGMKFGIPFDEALSVAKVAATLPEHPAARPRHARRLPDLAVRALRGRAAAACCTCAARSSATRRCVSSTSTSAAGSQ